MKTVKIVLTTITLTIVIAFMFGCQEEQAKIVQPTKTAKVEAVKPKETKSEKPQTAPKQPTKGQAKIEVKKPVHDFGKIAPKKRQKASFTFTNVGDGILKISKVKATCGCTVPKLKKKEYAPGESGTIAVSYNPNSTPGTVKKYLYIQSNDTENSRFKLTIKAFIEVKVTASPKKLNFKIDDKDTGAEPITVKSKDGTLFAIKSFRATGNSITADFDPEHKAVEHILNLKVDLTKLDKTPRGSIQIGTTHPDAPSITVTFNTLTRFSVNRPTFNIRNAPPGTKVIKEVWITSNYGESFEIEKSTSQKNLMKVVGEKKEGKHIKLKIQVSVPPITGKKRFFTDTMKIKIKDGSELTIRCSGWYDKKYLNSK